MAGAGRSVTCFEPRGVRTVIVGSARAQWHLGCVRQKTLAMPILSGRCQKSLAVPELGGAIADVDIEAEISRARTYSMGGSDLLGEGAQAPRASHGCCSGHPHPRRCDICDQSRRRAAHHARHLCFRVKGVSEEEDRAEPSSRAMTNDPVRASPELFRLGQSTMLR